MIKSEIKLEADIDRFYELYEKLTYIMEAADSYKYLVKHKDVCPSAYRRLLSEAGQSQNGENIKYILSRFASDANDLIIDYVTGKDQES